MVVVTVCYNNNSGGGANNNNNNNNNCYTCIASQQSYSRNRIGMKRYDGKNNEFLPFINETKGMRVAT